MWQDKIRDSQCTLCPLHENAQYVCLMGTGSRKASIMVVGEAPGAREDDEHAAFVGPAGKLLTELLEGVGLSREDVYITNATKCRPKDNATPGRTEVKACSLYLSAEIAKVRPEYILSLGNTALLALTGRSGITRYRGKLFPLGSGSVLPTFHPAAALRSPRYLPAIRADMEALARLVRGERRAALTTHVRLITNAVGIRWLKRKLELATEIAFDLETTGLKPEFGHIVTLGVAWAPGEAAVVPINHSSKQEPAFALRELKPLLEDPTKKYIAHNAKFDARWLAHFGIYVPVAFDTMLAAHVLDENQQKGLKPLSQILLGASDYDIGDDVRDAYNTDLKRLAVYNAKDCDYTLRLYHLFRDQLREQPRVARVFKKLMMPASDAFTRIEATGMYVDPERLTQRTAHAEGIIVKLIEYMDNWLPPHKQTINYNSPIQVAEWLFGDLKLDPIEVTGKGAPSTKESVLLQLAKEHKAARALLKYRKWSKFLSTYLVPWARALDNKSRLHTSYRLSGTVTGRLSSSDPNLQQVPRDRFIRSILGASKGWTFVEADYSQIELRIAAMLAREHNMLRAFHMGEDIHLQTACRETGKKPDEVTPEERKKAKAVSFGFLYGMGAAKFVTYARDNYDVEVSLRDAEAVRARFFEAYPNLRAWHGRQRRLVERYQRVSSPIGRVRHLPDMSSSDKEVRAESERQAINSPVQSLASDLMLVSAVRLVQSLNPRLARVVGSVHDALLFEVKDEAVPVVVEEIRATMQNVDYVKRVFGARITVPIEVEIKAGSHWGEGTVIQHV